MQWVWGLRGWASERRHLRCRKWGGFLVEQDCDAVPLVVLNVMLRAGFSHLYPDAGVRRLSLSLNATAASDFNRPHLQCIYASLLVGASDWTK